LYLLFLDSVNNMLCYNTVLPHPTTTLSQPTG